MKSCPRRGTSGNGDKVSAIEEVPERVCLVEPADSEDLPVVTPWACSVDRVFNFRTHDEVLDRVYHLVQEEDLILRIHSEELPPDEYYDELRIVLRELYPAASQDMIDHVVHTTKMKL